ncbi:MAG: DNA polymerase III subunit beta [Phycisphaerales bacterium]|nr:DNA polymerase III subunit beta [Phycisphaerales bacterium]
MKVICDRSALLDAVNLVSGVVASRTPRPQLTCIKLSATSKGGSGAGTLSLSATDGEVSIRMMTAMVEVQTEGEALVPADRLRAIVSAQDSEPTLTLETEGEITHITGKDAKYHVYGYPPADFPPLPGLPKDATNAFTIGGDTLEQLIARTTFSTARENSRYAINGVLIKRDGKKLEMVATDGRRLALAKANASGDAAGKTTCIVPTKALNIVGKLLASDDGDVKVAVTENQAIFAFDDGDAPGESTILATSLVEGTFPPYEDVIPKDQDKKATFDVGALGSAVKRAALLTNEESRGVRMAFGKGDKTARLTSRAPEMGEAEVQVDLKGYDGDDIEIGFNPAFITDALKVVQGDQVIFEMKAPNKPGLMKSGNDFVYVVMPVNLQ